MVQYYTWARDAHRAFPDDHSDHGHGRFARREKNCSTQRRNVSRFRSHVCDLAVGNRPAGRRSQLPPWPHPRPDRRALPECPGKTLLTDITHYTFHVSRPMTHKAPSLFDWNIVGPAIGDSFRKLDPRLMVKNPVMFVTMVGAVL